MGALRVIILWHQHQPFYKDLVAGEYRLPWVRLHALKDYYGMVKLLDEFPDVHQTFNLVPSLITQIQDYVAGTAEDPFLQVASKSAKDLSEQERRFALQYLFQANPVHMIGRYPRYRELWERFRSSGGTAERAAPFFSSQDFTDLQVLSQIAWFDEFFLADADIEALIGKGREFSTDEQRLVLRRERELLAKVLPAHAAAVKRGGVELSTSPFYHPILPLVCDSQAGGESAPGLPLPSHRYRRPDDAREQIVRGLDLHQRVFGVRPQGLWPSEGSVSEEVIGIASSLGVKWMATDEGVLGRSLGMYFSRDGGGRLPADLAEKLYTIHRYENAGMAMHMVFRDHTISDLIGFVYSGMPAQDAANHLISNIKRAAEPVLARGRDAVVSIILDGENAWEYYPKSGREFLRRFYDALQHDPAIEAVTVSEGIQRHRDFHVLRRVAPGSWINANFNVWIGAPEDNRSWDYLAQARNFYDAAKSGASERQRELAFEELLIAEGSDWNWWYGPEHHSANDRDFDELYRKHLSNVYQLLGSTPPDYLAQPIFGGVSRPDFEPQSAFIHPHITGDGERYFEWMGAACYTADHRSGAMHGKSFLLDSVYAGIDEHNLYGRLDFVQQAPEPNFELVVNVEAGVKGGSQAGRGLRLEVEVGERRIKQWQLSSALPGSGSTNGATRRSKDGGAIVDPARPNLASSADDTAEGSQMVKIALGRNFEFKLPLALLFGDGVADQGESTSAGRPGSSLRLRFSLWQNRLPVDALPVEGWMEVDIVSEEELQAMA